MFTHVLRLLKSVPFGNLNKKKQQNKNLNTIFMKNHKTFLIRFHIHNKSSDIIIFVKSSKKLLKIYVTHEEIFPYFWLYMFLCLGCFRIQIFVAICPFVMTRLVFIFFFWKHSFLHEYFTYLLQLLPW